MKHFLFLFLFPIVLFSQENDPSNGLRIHHLELTIGSGQGENANSLLCGGLELAAAHARNIFKVVYVGGVDTNLPGGNSIGDFREWSLLYGREFNLNHWLSFDPYAGIGLFGLRIPKQTDPSKTKMENSLGIPLEGNLRFSPWEHISLGVKIRHNFNSERDITFYGGFLQYRF